MTREQCKQLLPVMTAWADGKQLQYRRADGAPWEDVNSGYTVEFCCPPNQYRIKPEPRSVWLVEDRDGSNMAGCFAFPIKARADAHANGCRVIEFREVL